MSSFVNNLLAACKGRDAIYIYGAGQNASETYRFLERRGVKIAGFIVSDMTGNPNILFDCVVAEIDTFSKDSEYLILVPTLRNNRVYQGIYDCLIERQIQNVYFLSADWLKQIKKENLHQRKREICNTGDYYLGEDVPVEAEYNIFVMKNAKGQECHWRFEHKIIKEQDIESISDFFPYKTALEEFETQYGSCHVLRVDEPVGADRENTYAVYMARSHVDRAAPPENVPLWMIPI